MCSNFIIVVNISQYIADQFSSSLNHESWEEEKPSGFVMNTFTTPVSKKKRHKGCHEKSCS